MMYEITFSSRAIRDLLRLQCSEPSAYKKVSKFIDELKLHPRTGTGHPEPLRGDRAGQWSRQIT